MEGEIFHFSNTHRFYFLLDEIKLFMWWCIQTYNFYNIILFCFSYFPWLVLYYYYLLLIFKFNHEFNFIWKNKEIKLFFSNHERYFNENMLRGTSFVKQFFDIFSWCRRRWRWLRDLIFWLNSKVCKEYWMAEDVNELFWQNYPGWYKLINIGFMIEEKQFLYPLFTNSHDCKILIN